MEPAPPVADAIHRLRHHITQTSATLITLSDDELALKVPGKWSGKEILGHLIDSAINNLKRFTDAQVTSGPFLIQSYDQDRLVVVNRYQSLPLAHLVVLWRSLNEQILYVLDCMPDETLALPIQFGQPGKPESILSWLIDDYVRHLEHHLKTLL